MLIPELIPQATAEKVPNVLKLRNKSFVAIRAERPATAMVIKGRDARHVCAQVTFPLFVTWPHYSALMDVAKPGAKRSANPGVPKSHGRLASYAIQRVLGSLPTSLRTSPLRGGV